MARIDDDGLALGLPFAPKPDDDAFQQKIEEARQAADDLVAAVSESESRGNRIRAGVQRSSLGAPDLLMAALAGFLAGYVAARYRSR